jgi:arylsulfatase A-like enzyme
MISQGVSVKVGAADELTSDDPETQPGPIAFVLLAGWCGLVAGLLEVGTMVARKQTFDPNHLYRMSRHFVWLIPLTDVGLFLAMGLFGCLLIRARPKLGRCWAVRLVCALTLLPSVLIALPRMYGLASFVLVLGAAARLVPFFERHARGCRRLVLISSPFLVAISVLLGASLLVGDRIKENRESSRPLPPPGSPNVLWIVLDTVAAGHLSLYGYERETTTTLNELAERGIRFDRAQAASSWTLPSHATMFTGRWLHELSVGWLNPLDDSHPTLAEYLGSRGYATAGFIGNTGYCASDSGLGRGFTRYEDYVFPEFTAFKMAVLANRAILAIQSINDFLDDQRVFAGLHPYVEQQIARFVSDRKHAAVINHELLDWLGQRTQPQRPFLAFLNYGDAHSPYQLPMGRMRRFGSSPQDSRERALIQLWANGDKSKLSPRDVAFAAAAYDDCIADLDEQIGRLLDELKERRVLDQTWLFIAADHGESFGEHAGVFYHGTSLYQTEVHVPLLIVPPGGIATKRVVKESVSLRNLAATIVDVLNLESGSPFGGDSLASFWDGATPTASAPSSSEPALAEVVPNDQFDRDAYGLPNKTWPLGALKAREWSYIRREGDVREELFHIGEDAKEQRNLVNDPAARPILEQMRQSLEQLTGGPLLPQRFNR